ncbi:3-oxoadipate enol-lactonase [Kineococcus gynurae]|uniref:3-oxoadipate enol-lactonase n=1 Tax=Kineococcus gynurae TaxID=452979 RepID=A0ABV5LV65_9ACTN
MSGPVALHARWDRAEGRSRGVVVLLGSLGSDTTMWDPQVPVLRRHLDVLRIDHRGHGRSPAVSGPYSLDDLSGDVLAVLDREGVAEASLVGLSIGGMVAMSTALLAPKRLPRLVLLCSSASLGPASAWEARAARVLAEGPGAVAADVVSRWFSPAYAAEHPWVGQRMRDMIAATDRDGYSGCCAAIARMDLLPRLADLRSRVLAVAGEQDRTTPPEHLRAVADRIPGARFTTVPGAHLASWEDADLVNSLILDHLGVVVD